MSQESDLLFARHALQLGFVEAEAMKTALRECGGRGLEEELIRRNLLSAEDVEAVRSVVQATLRRKPAAAPAAAPGEEAPMAAPRGGDASRGIVGTVMLGRPRPGDRESGQERLSATAAGGAEASREGQIVICLGDDEAGLFTEILARARVQVSPEDPDLAALPESALPEAAPRDRRLYVSRKRSSGATLADALEEARHGAPGDPSRFTRAARDACVALACAHALGLAHRTLSPSSILLGDHGEVLVAGWEHARFLGAGAGPALPEQEAPFTVAEPCYASPEIGVAGAIYLADARSDVY